MLSKCSDFPVFICSAQQWRERWVPCCLSTYGNDGRGALSHAKVMVQCVKDAPTWSAVTEQLESWSFVCKGVDCHREE
eukprot:7108514-Ditylum_brightwellii.AAC.1